MKTMLFMSLFWKVNKDYKKSLKELNNSNELEKLLDYEELCKKQFNEYLNYLEQKDIKKYLSIENILS